MDTYSISFPCFWAELFAGVSIAVRSRSFESFFHERYREPYIDLPPLFTIPKVTPMRSIGPLKKTHFYLSSFTCRGCMIHLHFQCRLSLSAILPTFIAIGTSPCWASTLSLPKTRMKIPFLSPKHFFFYIAIISHFSFCKPLVNSRRGHCLVLKRPCTSNSPGCCHFLLLESTRSTVWENYKRLQTFFLINTRNFRSFFDKR